MSVWPGWMRRRFCHSDDGHYVHTESHIKRAVYISKWEFPEIKCQHRDWIMALMLLELERELHSYWPLLDWFYTSLAVSVCVESPLSPTLLLWYRLKCAALWGLTASKYKANFVNKYKQQLVNFSGNGHISDTWHGNKRCLNLYNVMQIH